MVRWTDRSWWSVEDAAQVLRVHTDTLYDACRRRDFPHIRVPYIRIPAEALLLTPRPSTRTRTYHLTDDETQLAFEFDRPIIPIRRWRNVNKPVTLGDYWANQHNPQTKFRNPPHN